MRLLFLVARPTQFEAPLFRYAAQDQAHRFKPLFWDPRAAAPVADEELERAVDWGFDLLAGYPQSVAPPGEPGAWLDGEIQQPCDLLIINGYTSRLCRGAARLARRRGIRTGLRLDSVIFPGERLRTFRRLVFRHLIGRWFDIFLGTSSLTLDYLRECGIPARRCALFPYAVDHDAFRAQSRAEIVRRDDRRSAWSVPPGARVLLTVSKLHPRETPYDLIQGMSLLPENVHLVVAGDGPDRAAAERHALTSAPGRVHFLGYAPYMELPGLYAACDVFVHAPSEERWGVSVAEALACDRPVVAGTRVGAGHDLIRPGGNGFIYRTGSPADLARCATAALALPADLVSETSTAVLERWGYAAAWQSLLAAAG